MVEEKQPSHKCWANLGGVEPQELLGMQLETLKLLDFKLYIGQKELEDYHLELQADVSR
jgi:hypothetical protein